MKHICVITTGGTIDSFADGDSLSVEENASGTLTHFLDEVVGAQASYDVTSPLNKNSEDFSLHDIEAIAATVDRKVQEGRRLFIVTHGSDTLHFTAAALGLIFAGQDVTLCLVAAFRPLFEADSDGPDNLKAAAALLLSDDTAPSTYVALKEDIDRQPVAIADWRAVKPLDFDSRGIERLDHQPQSLPPMELGFQYLGTQGHHVRFIQAYVGLNSDVLDHLTADAEVVVIGAYHSGTLPSSDDPDRGIIAFLKAHPEKLVLLCRHPDRAERYASVKRFETAGGMVIRHLLPHQTYVLVCLLKASGKDLAGMRDILFPFSTASGVK